MLDALALLISGGFFAFVVIRFGASRVRKEILSQNPDDVKLSRIWDTVITYFIPIASVVLLSWWLINDGANEEWYNPFAQSSIVTCVLQWGVVLLILIGINRWIVGRTERWS